jgi:hypothetical protein
LRSNAADAQSRQAQKRDVSIPDSEFSTNSGVNRSPSAASVPATRPVIPRRKKISAPAVMMAESTPTPVATAGAERPRSPPSPIRRVSSGFVKPWTRSPTLKTRPCPSARFAA